MELSTTVQLSDIIQWLVFLCGLMGTFTWTRITLKRHQSVLYNEQGEVRVVSYAALERIQVACRASVSTECDYVKKELDRVNSTASLAMTDLVKKIDSLSLDIRQLSKCVSILAAGGKAEDC